MHHSWSGIISLWRYLPRCTVYRKGIRLIFLNRDADMHGLLGGASLSASYVYCGNANELGEIFAGMTPGKSSLFFLTN
jgi:hypothetical protein